ncbi:MAG: DNA primase [Spirochaetota bacterium]|nr:DNA primase [Spirochaetota bacterium]
MDLIRDRAHIEEIVKKYVPSIKKRGNNYIALCPFHKEKTPSFTVSPEKQIFYCFGCQTGGNVFSFISKTEGLNYVESVKFVGNLVGIEIKDEPSAKNESKLNKCKEINRIAMDFYHDTIKSERGKRGLEYLLKRGINKNSILEFCLGYSPDSWDLLKNHFNNKNIPLSVPSEIGLLGESSKTGTKKIFDRFRNRIIFPIQDHRNDIVAFGGRIIGAGEPKYLNSPESLLFKKRDHLYGLNIAKKYISEVKRAIIVEGYLDVIGCHQHGVKNIVAPLGTALTINQIRLLSRFCSEIILLFDADSAGLKAALRSLETLEEVNVEVKIAILPEEDPFDYITKKGKREFMAIVDSAIEPIDFKIRLAAADYEKKDRLDVLFSVFNIIKNVKYDTEKNFYLKKASSILNIEESLIRDDYNKFISNKNKFETKSEIIDPNNNKIDFITRSHRDLIRLLCFYPQLIEKAILDFSEEEFYDTISKNIFKKLVEKFSNNDNITIDEIFDFFYQGEEKEFLEKNLFVNFFIENPDIAYSEIYINLKLYQIEQKISQYINEINKPVSNRNCEPNDYLAEIEVLRREKEKLQSYNYNKTV